MLRRARAALGLCMALGCGAEREPARSPTDGREAAPAPGGAERASEEGEPYAWQPVTRSPQRDAPANAELVLPCEGRDAALERVAAFAARRELAGKPALDAEDVTLVMRAEGAPYVWPHVWTLSGEHAAAQANERFAVWLAALPSSSLRRCGVAFAGDTGGRQVVVGLALDVLADLEPLPTQANVGAWLDVRARLLVPASAVQVLVLGPRGQAHPVPSSLDRGSVRARFHADREGPFLVQVLASVDGGPRPVAEAMVHAGAAPSGLLASSPAPGEQGPGAAPPADAIFGMLNRARSAEGSPTLKRDTRLERVAQAHAQAMRDAGRLAHDAGDGSPGDRVMAAGIAVRAVGENVAHAADALHAHRTLWRSPSHRSNLLETSYDAVGIGVVLDADGTLWVCQVFAALGRA